MIKESRETQLFTAAESELGKNRIATKFDNVEIELGVEGKAVHALHEGMAEIITSVRGENAVKPILRHLTSVDGFSESMKFTDEDIDDPVSGLIKCLDYVFCVGLLARIEQVNNRRPGITPKKFRMCAIHFPILASYGKYRMASGYQLVPTASAELLSMGKGIGCFDDKGRMMYPQWYETVLGGLAGLGAPFSEGLPVDTYIDSPIVYGIDIEDDGNIVGPEMIHPNAPQILLSLFVTSARIADLLGEYAVAYDHFASVVNTLRSIGMKSVHSSLDS